MDNNRNGLVSNSIVALIIALGLIAPHMVIMRLLIVVAMHVPRTARAIAIGVVAGASIDNDCVRLGCG